MHQSTTPAKHESDHSNLKSYAYGFTLSVLLTLAAYFVVDQHMFSSTVIYCVISVLALMQGAVQLILFLHIDKESKPRWNMLLFLFMLCVVIILVGGSIWIMANLDYNVMSKM